jgi:hypothetical protein
MNRSSEPFIWITILPVLQQAMLKWPFQSDRSPTVPVNAMISLASRNWEEYHPKDVPILAA